MCISKTQICIDSDVERKTTLDTIPTRINILVCKFECLRVVDKALNNKILICTYLCGRSGPSTIKQHFVQSIEIYRYLDM